MPESKRSPSGAAALNEKSSNQDALNLLVKQSMQAVTHYPKSFQARRENADKLTKQDEELDVKIFDAKEQLGRLKGGRRFVLNHLTYFEYNEIQILKHLIQHILSTIESKTKFEERDERDTLRQQAELLFIYVESAFPQEIGEVFLGKVRVRQRNIEAGITKNNSMFTSNIYARPEFKAAKIEVQKLAEVNLSSISIPYQQAKAKIAALKGEKVAPRDDVKLPIAPQQNIVASSQPALDAKSLQLLSPLLNRNYKAVEEQKRVAGALQGIKLNSAFETEQVLIEQMERYYQIKQHIKEIPSAQRTKDIEVTSQKIAQDQADVENEMLGRLQVAVTKGIQTPPFAIYANDDKAELAAELRVIQPPATELNMHAVSGFLQYLIKYKSDDKTTADRREQDLNAIINVGGEHATQLILLVGEDSSERRLVPRILKEFFDKSDDNYIPLKKSVMGFFGEESLSPRAQQRYDYFIQPGHYAAINILAADIKKLMQSNLVLNLDLDTNNEPVIIQSVLFKNFQTMEKLIDAEEQRLLATIKPSGASWPWTDKNKIIIEKLQNEFNKQRKFLAEQKFKLAEKLALQMQAAIAKTDHIEDANTADVALRKIAGVVIALALPAEKYNSEAYNKFKQTFNEPRDFIAQFSKQFLTGKPVVLDHDSFVNLEEKINRYQKNAPQFSAANIIISLINSVGLEGDTLQAISKDQEAALITLGVKPVNVTATWEALCDSLSSISKQNFERNNALLTGLFRADLKSEYPVHVIMSNDRAEYNGTAIKSGLTNQVLKKPLKSRKEILTALRGIHRDSTHWKPLREQVYQYLMSGKFPLNNGRPTAPSSFEVDRSHYLELLLKFMQQDKQVVSSSSRSTVYDEKAVTDENLNNAFVTYATGRMRWLLKQQLIKDTAKHDIKVDNVYSAIDEKTDQRFFSELLKNNNPQPVAENVKKQVGDLFDQVLKDTIPANAAPADVNLQHLWDITEQWGSPANKDAIRLYMLRHALSKGLQAAEKFIEQMNKYTSPADNGVIGSNICSTPEGKKQLINILAEYKKYTKVDWTPAAQILTEEFGSEDQIQDIHYQWFQANLHQTFVPTTTAELELERSNRSHQTIGALNIFYGTDHLNSVIKDINTHIKTRAYTRLGAESANEIILSYLNIENLSDSIAEHGIDFDVLKAEFKMYVQLKQNLDSTLSASATFDSISLAYNKIKDKLYELTNSLQSEVAARLNLVDQKPEGKLLQSALRYIADHLKKMATMAIDHKLHADHILNSISFELIIPSLNKNDKNAIQAYCPNEIAMIKQSANSLIATHALFKRLDAIKDTDLTGDVFAFELAVKDVELLRQGLSEEIRTTLAKKLQAILTNKPASKLNTALTSLAELLQHYELKSDVYKKYLNTIAEYERYRLGTLVTKPLADFIAQDEKGDAKVAYDTAATHLTYLMALINAAVPAAGVDQKHDAKAVSLQPAWDEKLSTAINQNVISNVLDDIIKHLQALVTKHVDHQQHADVIKNLLKIVPADDKDATITKINTLADSLGITSKIYFAFMQLQLADFSRITEYPSITVTSINLLLTGLNTKDKISLAAKVEILLTGNRFNVDSSEKSALQALIALLRKEPTPDLNNPEVREQVAIKPHVDAIRRYKDERGFAIARQGYAQQLAEAYSELPHGDVKAELPQPTAGLGIDTPKAFKEHIAFIRKYGTEHTVQAINKAIRDRVETDLTNLKTVLTRINNSATPSANTPTAAHKAISSEELLTRLDANKPSLKEIYAVYGDEKIAVKLYTEAAYNSLGHNLGVSRSWIDDPASSNSTARYIALALITLDALNQLGTPVIRDELIKRANNLAIEYLMQGAKPRIFAVAVERLYENLKLLDAYNLVDKKLFAAVKKAKSAQTTESFKKTCNELLEDKSLISKSLFENYLTSKKVFDIKAIITPQVNKIIVEQKKAATPEAMALAIPASGMGLLMSTLHTKKTTQSRAAENLKQALLAASNKIENIYNAGNRADIAKYLPIIIEFKRKMDAGVIVDTADSIFAKLGVAVEVPATVSPQTSPKLSLSRTEDIKPTVTATPMGLRYKIGNLTSGQDKSPTAILAEQYSDMHVSKFIPINALTKLVDTTLLSNDEVNAKTKIQANETAREAGSRFRNITFDEKIVNSLGKGDSKSDRRKALQLYIVAAADLALQELQAGRDATHAFIDLQTCVANVWVHFQQNPGLYQIEHAEFKKFLSDTAELCNKIVNTYEQEKPRQADQSQQVDALSKFATDLQKHIVHYFENNKPSFSSAAFHEQLLNADSDVKSEQTDYPMIQAELKKAQDSHVKKFAESKDFPKLMDVVKIYRILNQLSKNDLPLSKKILLLDECEINLNAIYQTTKEPKHTFLIATLKKQIGEYKKMQSQASSPRPTS